MRNLFNSVFSSDSDSTVAVWAFCACIGVALIAGLVYMFSYSYKCRVKASFKAAIFFLPAVVCAVIMAVNGNIGTGVAVAGAFSLVRFRSAQGNAKEITVIFMTMCTGLLAGVGYLAYAMLFTLSMCALLLLVNRFFRKKEKEDRARILKITIPENLDYTEVFSEIFAEKTEESQLVSVKTSNMGSLYKLTYRIKMKDVKDEKQFIDLLRVRNGNLEISLLRETENTEL